MINNNSRNQVGEKEKELERLRNELEVLRKREASNRDDHHNRAEIDRNRERDIRNELKLSARAEIEAEMVTVRDELARAKLEVEKRIAEVQAVEKSCADRERELDKECEVLNQKIHGTFVHSFHYPSSHLFDDCMI
jgi:predicted  nucleic acid-binding Zn-ribbon protein